MAWFKAKLAYQRTEADDLEIPLQSPSAFELSDTPTLRPTKSTSTTHTYGSKYHRIKTSQVHPVAVTVLSQWAIRFEGWRTGESAAATLALLSLLINLGVVIWL